GVWGWQKPREKNEDGKGVGEREPIDDLAAISWQGRIVYICFDSDAVTNPNVQLAEWELAKVLRSKGAIVKIIRLPQGEQRVKAEFCGIGKKPTNPHMNIFEFEKVGLDDHLVAIGPLMIKTHRENQKKQNPPQAKEEKTKKNGAAITLAHWKEKLKPAFREGNKAYCEDGRILYAGDLCNYPTSQLIGKL